MAFSPVIAAVAAGAVGAVGAIQQANAASASAKYNAAVQENNAKTIERNRKIALDQAESDASSKARENTRTLATIRANYGKSGLDMAGSALDVLEDSAIEGAFDVSKIRYQGEVRALGYTDEAAAQRAGAELSRMNAKSQQTAGYIGAASSLIGGVSKAGSSLAGGGTLTRS